MKLRSMLLVLGCCSPSYCQETGTNSPVSTETVARAVAPTELEWNVEPSHWEKVTGVFPALSVASSPPTSPVPAGTAASPFDLTVGAGIDGVGAMSAADVDRVLHKIEKHEGLSLGNSGHVVRSPIIEGLLPRRARDGASLGEKLLNLPVVRWLVPQPMPEPPGGGRYFRWGESEERWRDFGRPEPRPGALDNGM